MTCMVPLLSHAPTRAARIVERSATQFKCELVLVSRTGFKTVSGAGPAREQPPFVLVPKSTCHERRPCGAKRAGPVRGHPLSFLKPVLNSFKDCCDPLSPTDARCREPTFEAAASQLEG